MDLKKESYKYCFKFIWHSAPLFVTIPFSPIFSGFCIVGEYMIHILVLKYAYSLLTVSK